jgi:hypothetical protein
LSTLFPILPDYLIEVAVIVGAKHPLIGRREARGDDEYGT